MKKALLKDSLIQIKKTSKRFISMLLMAFMGVGFFAGIRATSPDMKKTMDSYLDTQNVFDIQIVSTLGLTDDDISALSNIENVEKVYGLYSEEVFSSFSDLEEVVKVIEYNENINTPELIEGNVPQNSDECIIDRNIQKSQNIKIGDYIDIKEDLDDDEDPTFVNTKLKVVGIVKSPLYISRDRGTTPLGSGKISYFMYVPKENINSESYTEVDIIAQNAKDMNYISDKYNDYIEDIKNEIEKIKVDREKSRHDELVLEANSKLNDAQQEFDEKKADGEKEIQDAEKKIQDGEKEIADGEQKLKDEKEKADKQFADAEVELANAQDQVIRNQEALDDQRAYFEAKKNEAEVGKQKINEGLQTINATLKDLEENKALAENVLNGIEQIDITVSNINSLIEEYERQLENSENKEEIENQIAKLKAQAEDLNKQKQELLLYGITNETLEKINAGIAECNTQKQELESQLSSIINEIASGESKLQEGQNQLTNAWNQIQSSKTELANKKIEANQEIAKAESELEDAKIELADGKKELEDAKQEFNEKITEAEAKLIDAREKVNDIKNAKWYIWGRDENTGLNSYSQDSENIERLGEAFPVVFFIIATLISLTTMSRMVEEERVQIGTLKALGYNKMQIMSKYIIYSLFASVIGGFLGALFGLKFFPFIIIMMYGMMYDMPTFILEFNVYYTLIGIGIMTACIVGATIITASKELASTPAQMMRPKAPKAGKRVLLEKIPFIWNKLSFTQKVTLRNMFRYKKRFLMTVIGIMGCTALILAGFGLKDSISRIMDFQYVDIYNYDMLIGLKDTLTKEEISSLITEVENNEKIEKVSKAHVLSDTLKNNDLEEDAQIFIVENNSILEGVINLKDVKSGEKLELNDDEIILTDKLAQLISAKVGDKIIIQDSEENEYEVKVGGITEHYIQHYAYMTNALYNKIFDEEVSPNVLLTTYSIKLSEEEENKLSETLLTNPKIASVTLSSYLITIMDDTLSAMNIVVYILILSAGLLAFIVLYNLANVNISERIRELATIKVLGFYDKEVYDYVTREIVLLTIIGIIIGLVFGYALNAFILGTCEIGILRFKRIITFQSYIVSALITIVFTYIVNLITYFSLKKVDMIESLKSVE